MTPRRRYIVEGNGPHHLDGMLARREALRRLALLGVGAAVAPALIGACAENKKPAPGSTTTSAPPPPGSEHTLPTAPVNWPGPNGQLQGAWAETANPRGAVLVIHGNRGLNDWVRSVTGRFAGAGYSALAVDLLSEEGGRPTFTSDDQATAALGKVPNDRLNADVKSGVDELQRRLPDKKLAVAGFSFGGRLVWQLLAAGEPRLSAAVPFYGPWPGNVDFSGSKQAAVLAFYGSLDNRVTSTQQSARDALDRAGMVNKVIVEQNADHSFFNDADPQRYNRTAAADAWERTLDWLGRYLG